MSRLHTIPNREALIPYIKKLGIVPRYHSPKVYDAILNDNILNIEQRNIYPIRIRFLKKDGAFITRSKDQYPAWIPAVTN